MTVTVTDLFAGAGGSSTGAMQLPGVKIRIAANHWQLVTDIHAMNHPDADHAVVDLHQENPAFFPKTDVLWASPECTKWSQANGTAMPSIEEGLFEDPLSDEAKNRSRLLMFDVLKFIDYHRYRLVIVENVVDIATQAKYRTAWTVWRQDLRNLGYQYRVVSLNSMHAQLYGAPAPQSRDRIYIVAWPEGDTAPDLDRALRPKAYCPKCGITESVQSFKPGRTVGRYRQAYEFCCPTCGQIVEPGWMPAAAAIDWSLPGTRIGDRLSSKTRLRVAHGIARYWSPMAIEATGNTYDAADPNHPHHGDPDAYYRAWPATDPLKALHTTNSKALAVPVEGRDGKDALPIDVPARTQTTRAETALAQAPFIAEMYGTSTARPVTAPAGTFTARGNHHGLAQAPFVTQFRERNRDLDPAVDPLRTIVADGASHALVLTNQHNNRTRPVSEALPTATTATGGGHGLLTRNVPLIHRHNNGGAEMSTPASEYMRTLTTGGNVSLLQAKRQVTAVDLEAAMKLVPEVLFRMFEPHEVAAGMAFPADYKWQLPDRAKPVSKRDLVKAAGNAVTPPCSRDLLGVCIESMFHRIDWSLAA